MTLPLEGIRVLDLARGYPGAYTCTFLGDFGADVLKVDPPGMGMIPLPLGVDEETWAAYNYWERNKRSIILNLKHPEAREILLKMVKDADVLVEGFRPGVMKRLSLDYETLKEVNPKLVYCSLTGYGQDGPYKEIPGHDTNYISVAGALSIIRPPEGPPIVPSNMLADGAGGGMHAAIGILTALLARERSGKGQHVDVSLTDGVISLLGLEVSRFFATGKSARPGRDLITGSTPYLNIYRTKDGKYISICCVEPSLWANLCRELGREDFIALQNAEGKKKEEIFGFLRETFLTRTRDEWFELLSAKNIAVAPVYDSLEEVFNDPQVRHREMIVEIEHPKFGRVKQLGISIKLSETAGRIKNPGPVSGAHTAEVLLGLGYSPKEMERLRREGVIG